MFLADLIRDVGGLPNKHEADGNFQRAGLATNTKKHPRENHGKNLEENLGKNLGENLGEKAGGKSGDLIT